MNLQYRYIAFCLRELLGLGRRSVLIVDFSSRLAGYYLWFCLQRSVVHHPIPDVGDCSKLDCDKDRVWQQMTGKGVGSRKPEQAGGLSVVFCRFARLGIHVLLPKAKRYIRQFLIGRLFLSIGVFHQDFEDRAHQMSQCAESLCSAYGNSPRVFLLRLLSSFQSYISFSNYSKRMSIS